MNNLNSVIIEGKILSFEIGNVGALLTIGDERSYTKSDGSQEKEVTEIETVCYGNLARSVEKWAEVGRGIRIVGRLKSERCVDSTGKKYSRLVVVAEHIEYKPEVKKN